jgi:spermidine/putrescine transport system ATP-binding protein
MSDRIAVMDRGRVEQLGPAAEVYHRPRTAFVAGFIGQSNLLPAVVVRRESESATVHVGNEIELNVAGWEWEDATTVGGGGNEVTISIRPEKLRLHVNRPPGGNEFEAEVREQLFKGAIDQFLLRTRSGLEFTAVADRGGSAGEAVRTGSRVFCQVRPADVVIVCRNAP